jgi:hypothetical protein
LNPEKIDETSPKYIQNLIKAGFPSMLHFELHNSPPPPLKQKIYMGGNYFIDEKPANLEDPTPFLSNIPAK